MGLQARMLWMISSKASCLAMNIPEIVLKPNQSRQQRVTLTETSEE